MTSRLVLLLVAVAALSLTRCDSDDPSDGMCLSVQPTESYTLSGVTGTMTFAPGAKTYVVENTCSTNIMLSVEEDVRWLDVEIDAFGEDESGVLAAAASINVVIEVRYGSDNPERLDQLAPGTYDAEIRFDDDTNDDRVVRSVALTVNGV